MFKLVVLTCLLAIAAAKPSVVAIQTPLVYSPPLVRTAVIQEPARLKIQEHTLAKVGDVVESVPTAVSSQSSTVVHSRANVVTPLVAPAVRSYSAPVVAQYALPYSYGLVKTPLYKTLVPSVPVAAIL